MDLDSHVEPCGGAADDEGETTGRMLGPGDTFGETALFPDVRYPAMLLLIDNNIMMKIMMMFF